MSILGIVLLYCLAGGLLGILFVIMPFVRRKGHLVYRSAQVADRAAPLASWSALALAAPLGLLLMLWSLGAPRLGWQGLTVGGLLMIILSIMVLYVVPPDCET